MPHSRSTPADKTESIGREIRHPARGRRRLGGAGTGLADRERTSTWREHRSIRTPAPPHFPARATRVIYLFMHGGPSHLETFDPKPDLQRLARPAAAGELRPVATRRKVAANPLLATKRTFRRCGQSGIEISDFLPHIARCADDLAVIRSCWADSVNHPQAVYQMNTGSILMGKPSLGSWVELWPGDREPGPARLRRPARPRRRHQGRPAGLRRGVPAGDLSGHRHARRGRSRSSTSARPRACPAERQRRTLDLIGQLERPPPRRPRRRRRARGADPGLRAGLPDAERRPRGRRPGAARRTRRSRLYGLDDQRDGRVRHPLPAGPPAGRAGRAVRPALLGRRHRLGRPRRRRGEPRRACAAGPTSRSPACSGPEAARAARRARW